MFQQDPGATPIDPDEIRELKLGHITTREELNRFEQENISNALHWLESRRGMELLNEKFVRTLHKKMFGNVWRWAGSFRRSEKNIGISWQQIPVQLHALLQNVRYWVEHQAYSPDEIAVRLHHKLVWIHLFANGNGRHARLMTDRVLKIELKQEPFSWNTGNMTGEDRNAYIQALRAADNSDYSKLMAFVRGK